MPSDYAGNYARNIAGIYSQLAESEGAGARQRGAIWGNAFQTIGDTIAEIPGRMAQQKESDARAKLDEENLRRASQERQEDAWLSQAINASVVDGKIVERRLTEELVRLGGAQLVPKALKTLRESDMALETLRNAQQRGDLDAAGLRDAALAFFAPFARDIEASDYDPVVISGALTAVEFKAGKGQADDIRQLFATSPEAAKAIIRKLAARPAPKVEAFTTREGEIRREPMLGPDSQPMLGADGQPVYREFAGPEKPQQQQSLQQALDAAILRGDGQEVARLRNELARNAAATRAPQQPSATRYQRADVTLPDGTVAVANYDAQTGKYTNVDTGTVLTGVTGAPTSEQRNKAAARADAAGMIDMLKRMSERIIKRVGPAQRRDAAKRGVAAVFGNDPEFRTYQDLRYSLAMNLAVMQQGSRPTDPDVQKGALPVVPDPFSDTSESATMKWAYVDTLVKPKGGIIAGQETIKSAPAAVQDALKSQGPGRYTLSDGSVWEKDASGALRKVG